MGCSCSCLEAESRGTEKRVFVWKIDGFTSLLEEGGGLTHTCFKMLDIKWLLSINLMDRKSGATDSEKHVSLDLRPTGLCTNYILETKVKFFIIKRRDRKHIERQVSHTFSPSSDHSCEVSCMIPLETLKNLSLGSIAEDYITFGVEFIEFKKVPWNGVEMITFIHKNKSSSGSCSWYIEDFSQLSRPNAYSNPFKIGEYTWRLRLEQQNAPYQNGIGLYLMLDEKSKSQLPPSSGVMVDAVISIKRQSREVLAYDSLGTGTLDPYKRRFCSNLTIREPCVGYQLFIRLADFQNKSNGYLVKGTCTIEASATIIGYGNEWSF